ncbi:pseudouridine synthase [Chitinophaga horti]|uniref:Pseudouridine synthase n=1 Tax=Chitinophaga horti TaxID=2920382 RepID=A0ABY6JCC6_9BACT|nr:RluA family pseudouridine synthase [Chitinophaga horti]UYQ95954.1 pseudouridine synthase [Chitinophaga horti]
MPPKSVANQVEHSDTQHKITYFPEQSVSETSLPERFTFPFYYEPHPLARLAAADLQRRLEQQTDLDHNFGLEEDQDGLVIGKMFGVLVVQDAQGRLGYLSGFSGKLAGTNDHGEFVPPVFDMLAEGSFFLEEQANISQINTKIEDIESSEKYLFLKASMQALESEYEKAIAEAKRVLKQNKARRKQLRLQQKPLLSQADYEIFEADLIKQSLRDKHLFNVLHAEWEQRLAAMQADLSAYHLDDLKAERKERSAALQQRLFEAYSFLNIAGKSKSLQAIFTPTAFGKPPAGAGECATPKLLQFAFTHGYKPLAMAEFWWGSAPTSEIRKHKQFYPACMGKCKPILEHMLEGMAVDDNPLLQTPEKGLALDIVFEDDSFVVVNKPPGLRSVPGINVADSVYSRLKQAWGEVEPGIIHRLDMDTSGLLVVAKTPEAHKDIQRQFLKRTVTKRYRAILSGVIGPSEGQVDLPLYGDVLNRPRQLVCFVNGKRSVTNWKVVERYADTTRIDFWPLTGRTHQLRMHAAHELGLNTPIVGDELYGTGADRMCLHAAYLQFIHPVTKLPVSFEVPEAF